MSKRPLERIDDEELNNRLNAVRAHIRRTRQNNGDTRDAEVELCYLEREYEVRENRKNAHETYIELVKNQHDEYRRQAQEEEEAVRSYLRNSFQSSV